MELWPLISVTVSLGPCHNFLLKCNSRRGQVPLQIIMAFSLVRKLVDWTYSSFFSATKNLHMKLKVWLLCLGFLLFSCFRGFFNSLNSPNYVLTILHCIITCKLTQNLLELERVQFFFFFRIIKYYHQLNGHEFRQILGDHEGQRSLVYYSPWGIKELDTT